jgi:hypothetical protein
MPVIAETEDFSFSESSDRSSSIQLPRVNQKVIWFIDLLPLFRNVVLPALPLRRALKIPGWWGAEPKFSSIHSSTHCAGNTVS